MRRRHRLDHRASYIVYGRLQRATSVIDEGTPDYPDKDRWWSIVDAASVTILYTPRPRSAPHEVRAGVRAEHDPRRCGCWVGRRADQPRGLDLVSRAHRRRPHARSSTLVADRDRDDHDHAAAGDHDAEAGLGDQPFPGVEADVFDKPATRSGPAAAATSC